jgi:predicted nucleotidyltransferase component of viral defense system
VSVNPALIEEIAAELVVDASLIEKDWYAMRIIAVVARVKHPTMRLVFSGGTSLSKGYGLIQRFSEDIDFKVAMPAAGLNRGAFREYREQIVKAIRAGSEDWSLDKAGIKSLNESRFFKCEIAYRQQFRKTSALRPNVRLEVTFDPPALPFEERPLQSFVAQAQKHDPEVTSIPCVSPVETAADKLSALVWRVAIRDRKNPQDDATFIRHLHDLAALEGVIDKSNEFVPLVQKCLVKDASRDKQSGTATLPPVERLRRMLDILESDPLYQAEYEQFVLGMSYAADAERLNFRAALQVATRLVDLLS